MSQVIEGLGAVGDLATAILAYFIWKIERRVTIMEVKLENNGDIAEKIDRLLGDNESGSSQNEERRVIPVHTIER